ncbi:hypothetical protein SCLCIDRAFT_21883 [Scleroderma citrinum Foug A]|uniref:Uncharacterized protein n=1 Tax=Scleroderma citrinum Foug A TaxID=1036808 RepID=A0A0C3EEP0_9AGAM|nr:hypothetical protein SCLCIDRAFT_21883 [Scleroderma citrinum Foug A]
MDKYVNMEVDELVHNILLANDFELEDLLGFNAETAIKKMDKSEAALAPSSLSADA